jgi:hypothetical protein
MSDRKPRAKIDEIRVLIGEILVRAIGDSEQDAEHGCRPEEVVLHLTYDEARTLEKLLK